MDAEYLEHKIILYRVKFLLEEREIEKEKFIAYGHNDKTFVHISRNRQRDEYINTAKVENIIEECFTLGIALRY